MVTGIVTALAGAAAGLAPRSILRLAFGSEPTDAAAFFARNWGVLVGLVGGLLIYAAYAPASRTAILVVAAAEKFVLVACVFLGPLKRTRAMTAIALGDGLFAVLYVLYLAGV